MDSQNEETLKELVLGVHTGCCQLSFSGVDVDILLKVVYQSPCCKFVGSKTKSRIIVYGLSQSKCIYLPIRSSELSG